MAYQDTIIQNLIAQGLLPANFAKSEDDSTALQTAMKLAQQQAGIFDEDQTRIEGDTRLLDALKGYGISQTPTDTRGQTVSLNGKQYLTPENASGATPDMIENVPGWGPLVDNAKYRAVFGDGESTLNKWIGRGLEAGMVGGLGGLAYSGAGLAGDAAAGGAGAGTAATGTAVPGAYTGSQLGTMGVTDIGTGAATGAAGGAVGGAATGAGGPGIWNEAITGMGGGQASLGGLGALGSAGSAVAGTGGTGTTFGIPNNVLAGAAQGIGGLLAANSTGDAMKDVSNQYLALGAPSRARFEGSFAPGFDLLQAEPGLQGAMDTAANTSARALSTRFGNPADSPAAQAEMQKYLAGSLYLPQLNTYRSQNLTGGGQGVNVAGTGSLGAANSAGQGWEAIGAGLGTALNPQPSIADLFKTYGLGGNQQQKLSIGGLPYGGANG